MRTLSKVRKAPTAKTMGIEIRVNGETRKLKEVKIIS